MIYFQALVSSLAPPGSVQGRMFLLSRSKALQITCAHIFLLPHHFIRGIFCWSGKVLASSRGQETVQPKFSILRISESDSHKRVPDAEGALDPHVLLCSLRIPRLTLGVKHLQFSSRIHQPLEQSHPCGDNSASRWVYSLSSIDYGNLLHCSFSGGKVWESLPPQPSIFTLFAA